MLSDVKVEAGFGSTMFTASPTWTNVSGHPRELTIDRGRQAIDEAFVAGTASVRLDNRDGRFDPNNSAGVYNPNVKIGVPIRVTITVNLTTYPMFYGSAREWSPVYPKSGDSYVEVPLVDGFYNLNSSTLDGRSYPQQATDARINAVLDDIGWPAGLRDIDTGVAEVQAVTFEDAVPALEHLQETSESEVGVLFMTRDGKVAFRNRVSNSGAAAASTVFDDSAMQALIVRYNDDYLYNDARITALGGTQQTAVDSTSISDHGRRVLAKTDLPMVGDSAALNVAEWKIGLHATQRLRAERLTLKMHDTASYLEDVLALELRNLVNLEHTPPAGDSLDQDCAVEGIHHVMTPGDWTAHLSVSPLTALEQQSFIIFDSYQFDDPEVFA